MLFWSQKKDRIGLFARRFGPAGETVEVPARGSSVLSLAIQFLVGRGIVATIELPSSAAGRLDLFDVEGRRVGSSPVRGNQSGAITLDLPGSASLAPGIYVARLSSGPYRVKQKVVAVH